MRILNRRHIPWFLFVLLATLAAGWIYLGNFDSQRLPPRFALLPALLQTPSEHRSIGGTPVGLIFGAVALGIFVFGVLLSLRKKFLFWPLGSVQLWMRAHIWLTLLSIPLVLFHSGFRVGGAMTQFLLCLYGLVMLSGIYGLFLQHVLPQMMKERLPYETVHEQVPHIRAQLFRGAERMRDNLRQPALQTLVPAALTGPPTVEPTVSSFGDPVSTAALVTFLEEQIMPYLKSRRPRRNMMGNPRYAEDAFRFVSLNVSESYRTAVNEIQGWCEQRRLLDLQTRLHHWLHVWLFVHVPFSFLLIVVTLWHAFVTLFYY